MVQVPVPLAVTQRISDLAVQRAREGLQRRGWSEGAQTSLEPAASIGGVGIRTSRRYLMFQERGTRPFLMTALEGKTVPINGQFFHVRNVGMPGMGYQDRKYDQPARPVWREQRWRHPGIRPEGFMQNAISQAILESRPTLQAEVNRILRGEGTTDA